MMQSECRSRADIHGEFDWTSSQQLAHRLVDMYAIAKNLLDGRSRQQPALRARIGRANGLVIRIEKMIVLRMKNGVARGVRTKEKRLEEPRRVSHMPLGRTHVGHRLDDVVLGREGPAQRFRLASHFA